VLVVDDHDAFRDAAHWLLERRGYAVVAEASCAATALDAVERFAPQAVLLDVRLGDDDGFDVCRRLTRARPELAVLLASTGEHEEVPRAGGDQRRPRLHQQDEAPRH
jgi:DNA-binding NarL/FixJ family response regulator